MTNTDDLYTTLEETIDRLQDETRYDKPVFHQKYNNEKLLNKYNNEIQRGCRDLVNKLKENINGTRIKEIKYYNIPIVDFIENKRHNDDRNKYVYTGCNEMKELINSFTKSSKNESIVSIKLSGEFTNTVRIDKEKLTIGKLEIILDNITPSHEKFGQYYPSPSNVYFGKKK